MARLTGREIIRITAISPITGNGIRREVIIAHDRLRTPYIAETAEEWTFAMGWTKDFLLGYCHGRGYEVEIERVWDPPITK